MTDLLPTEKQASYAESLVGRLADADHWRADLYRRRVAACDDIADMSKLIDRMKTELAEVAEVDAFVEESHRTIP